MRPLKRFSILFILLITCLIVFPQPVSAQSLADDDPGHIVFGGEYTLESGETLEGDLVIFGGQVDLEEGSLVNGNIVLTGGTLDIHGEVNGDVTAVGGVITLHSTSIVNGNLDTVGSSLQRYEGSEVNGRISSDISGDIDFGRFIDEPFNFQPYMPTFARAGEGLWIIFRALIMGALAVLASLFLQKPTQRVANTVIQQPAVSGGIGLLTYIVMPIILVMLAITLILIPISLIALVLVVVAVIFGWLAIGHEVGIRMADLFKTDWAPAVNDGIGTMTLTFLASLLGLIPCIGWFIPFLVSCLGLGAVILSRFGTQNFVRPNQSAPAPATLSNEIVEVANTEVQDIEPTLPEEPLVSEEE
jgi:uncharacterized membrane protein